MVKDFFCIVFFFIEVCFKGIGFLFLFLFSMRCVIVGLCIGVDCCIEVVLIYYNFYVYFDIDFCNL